MKFLLKKIHSLGTNWNERRLNEDDFYRLCKKHKVTAEELPLRVSGFYYKVGGKHYIAIDSKLPREKKLFVMFHEFAHFLFHAPESGATANFHGVGQRTRKEKEADIFALAAIIPQNWLTNRTETDLLENEGINPETLAERKEIFEMYGI